MKFATTALIILVLPTSGSAHHSRAEFSDEIQVVEGELVEIEWRNPHPVLTLRVVNDSGEAELMSVEGWQSANSLLRKGLTEDAFTVGDTVRAAIQPSSRRAGLVLGTSVSLGNGTQAILKPGYEPFWPDEAVIGSDATGRSTSGDSTGEGLFRVWTYRDRQGAGDLPLTAAAETKLAEFDELEDHPLWNCDAVGMPVAMDTGLPIEFIDRGDTIVMRIEQNDNTRTFHLDGSSTAAESSAMGHSVARWDDDTLVVTTSGSNYPYFNDDGVPKSVDMSIDERFRVDAATDSLSWEATMTDPLYLSEPVTISANWHWVPGETIETWNCAVSR
ncbi:MAG: DUF6152 family protein [Gammaproteobacteria bacterium]